MGEFRKIGRSWGSPLAAGENLYPTVSWVKGWVKCQKVPNGFWAANSRWYGMVKQTWRRAKVECDGIGKIPVQRSRRTWWAYEDVTNITKNK